VSIFSYELLAAWTKGHWNTLPGSAITGFGLDTRHLVQGEMFVAIKTDKRDGHNFLNDAQKAGASCALVERIVPGVDLPQLIVGDSVNAFQVIAKEHRRLFKGKVVGITGSAGKTSTKELLALLLGAKDGVGVLATEGNLNNYLGVPLTLTRIDLSKHAYAVIEAGISGPNEMQMLADMIEPDAALVTLIAAAHLEGLGSLDGVANEKSILLRSVKGGTAFFPSDCLQFNAFKSLPGKTCAVGDHTSEVGAKVAHHSLTTEINLVGRNAPNISFSLPRVSAGMASNVALALFAALDFGVPSKLLNERLKSWSTPRLRGQIIHDSTRLIYLDCYNANPASMMDALQSFERVSTDYTQRLFVIGCMEELGTQAVEYHIQFGKNLTLKPADHVILLGDNATHIATQLKVSHIQINPKPEDISKQIEAFTGAIFMKGSRRYALEKFIPNLVTTSGTH
jgi:UDP-N-acetylmuramoyl-tripeptide--D-alanyl-D-alanine ligase